MTEPTTRKKSIAAEEHDASDEKTYKVWIEIEEYDELTGCGNDCGAPGGALATFGTYEEAYDFAEQAEVTAPIQAQRPSMRPNPRDHMGDRGGCSLATTSIPNQAIAMERAI